MTYIKSKWLWLGMVTPLLIIVVLLCAACGSEDGPLPTGSSSFQASPDSSSALQLGQVSRHSDDDSSDDDSSDDDSSDDSSDDNSSDDNSSDDNSSDDDGLEDARVRGLLSASTCPIIPPEFTIDGRVVTTTAETRFDCEPGCNGGLGEQLDADDFCAFILAGLPMRARGADDGSGGIVATRVRIDDQIKVTGMISNASDDLAGGFTLTLASGPPLSFVVDGGALIDTFAANSMVRVEGTVPSLSLSAGGLPTFVATEIENEN